MKSISIIKSDKNYWIHSQSQTTAGLWIANEPYLKFPLDITIQSFIDNIYLVLNNSRTNIPHPKDWSTLNKEFLKRMGFKSRKDLYKGNKLCTLTMDDRTINILPTNNSGINGGFEFIPSLEIKVPITAHANELYNELQVAFEKCN